jgi:hypothetical protein
MGPRPSPETPSTPPPVFILVIQTNEYDWNSVFSDIKLDCGRRIKIIPTGWQNISLHVDTNSHDARDQSSK